MCLPIFSLPSIVICFHNRWSHQCMKASLSIIQRKSLSDPFHILYKSGSFLPSTNCQSRLNGCNRRKEFFRQWNLQPMLVVVGWALVWARRNKSIILYLAGCSGSVTLSGGQEEYFFLERHNLIISFTSLVNNEDRKSQYRDCFQIYLTAAKYNLNVTLKLLPNNPQFLDKLH